MHGIDHGILAYFEKVNINSQNTIIFCLPENNAFKVKEGPLQQGAVLLTLSAGELQSLSAVIRVLAHFLFMLTLLQDENITDVCSIIPNMSPNLGWGVVQCLLSAYSKTLGKICCRLLQMF